MASIASIKSTYGEDDTACPNIRTRRLQLSLLQLTVMNAAPASAYVDNQGFGSEAPDPTVSAIDINLVHVTIPQFPANYSPPPSIHQVTSFEAVISIAPIVPTVPLPASIELPQT